MKTKITRLFARRASEIQQKKVEQGGGGKTEGKARKRGREFRIRIKPSTFGRRESGEGAILLAYTTGFCTSFSDVLERARMVEKSAASIGNP